MDIEDKNGTRTTVTDSYWRRWPQLKENFRPVADDKATPVAVKPPTGDKKKEN